VIKAPLEADASLSATHPQKNSSNESRKALLPMSTLAMTLGEYLQDKLAPVWPVIVRVTFGAFIGSLVLLLILTYANVPVVSGV
jgi:hypothetical protein